MPSALWVPAPEGRITARQSPIRCSESRVRIALQNQLRASCPARQEALRCQVAVPGVPGILTGDSADKVGDFARVDRAARARSYLRSPGRPAADRDSRPPRAPRRSRLRGALHAVAAACRSRGRRAVAGCRSSVLVRATRSPTRPRWVPDSKQRERASRGLPQSYTLRPGVPRADRLKHRSRRFQVRTG